MSSIKEASTAKKEASARIASPVTKKQKLEESDSDNDSYHSDSEEYNYTDSDDDDTQVDSLNVRNMEQKRRYLSILSKFPFHKQWCETMLAWELNPPRTDQDCHVALDVNDDNPLEVSFTIFDAESNVRGNFKWAVPVGGQKEHDESLLYPIVPPTMTFEAPRLLFKHLLQLHFWPDFQSERWNFCTDLSVVFQDIIALLFSSKPIDNNLNLGKPEHLLLALADKTRIFPSFTTSSSLPTFGVTKMSPAGGGGNSSKSSTRVGFTKGTGYSDRRSEKTMDATTWNAKAQESEQILNELWLVKEALAPEVLLGSSLINYILATLAAASLNEFESKSEFYSNVFEWCLVLLQKEQEHRAIANAGNTTTTTAATTMATTATNGQPTSMSKNMQVLTQQLIKCNDDLQGLVKLSGSSGQLEQRLMEINQQFQEVYQTTCSNASMSSPTSSASSASSASSPSLPFPWSIAPGVNRP